MSIRTPLVRRVPILAAISLVALAGCGSDDPSAARDTAPPAASDASVDTDADTDADPDVGSDELRDPKPIEVTSSGRGDAIGAGGTTTEAMADSRAALDMMIAPTYVADFVVSGDLPALPGNTTGYVYDASTEVTAEQAQALAAHFGVEGEAVRVDEWEPGGWQIGPNDGSAPSVFVSDDGQMTWSFSPAWTDQPAMEGCAAAVATDGSAVPDTVACPEPQPPAGVPTAEDAEASARELLAALGVDASGMKFETFADEWSASVNVTEFVDGQIDGIPTGRYWGFGFGAEGVLQWANGSLGTPQPVGPYELIDLDTALARLREQFMGSGAPMPVDLVDPAVGDRAVTDAATSDMVAPEPRPADVEILPAPGETFPAPEPITVTLVDVQPDLWWAWDADASVWMVPAYRFIGDDGGWYTVPAVTDEYLVQAAPGTTEPAPEPAPAPSSAVPDGTVAPDGSAVATTVAPVVEPDEASALEPLVGLSIEEFGANAEAMGWKVRVAEIDGQSQALTMDFNPSRVNVAVSTNADGTQTVTAILNVG